MVTKSSPTSMDNPSDDFKLIRGIGPSIERRLHAAGIHAFIQLASLTPEEVAGHIGNLIGLSVEHVAQQDWIGQARELAARYEEVSEETETTASNGHLHYSVFTVELLLDEANNVRRTRVMHVQSQSEATWGGWGEAQLVNFITESAALKIPQPRETPTLAIAPLETAVPEPALEVEPESVTHLPASPGSFRLSDMAIKVAGFEGSHRLVPGDQPFNIDLTLDLAELKVSRDIPLDYSAVIYAKRLGRGTRRVVGSTGGTLSSADRMSVGVKGIRLSSGTYRIKALVELKPPAYLGGSLPGMLATTESDLVKVL